MDLPFGSYIIGPRIECTMSRMNADRPGIYFEMRNMPLFTLKEITHVSNIKTKVFSADRLEYIIKNGLFQETEIENLDMGKGGHELQLDPEMTAKFHVFQKDGHAG